MHSSTSSSNDRVPDLRYGPLWLMAFIVFIGIASCEEVTFRNIGHRPTVADNVRFWAIHRADVYTDGNEKRLVIAGASRAQLGLVPSVMEKHLAGYKVKQLAINGTAVFAVVRDLCEDPNFNGVILWSAWARTIFPPADDSRWDVVYTRFFHDQFPRVQDIDDNINCYLAALLQSHMVTLSPYLTLKWLLASRFRPKVSYINMQFSRYNSAGYYDVMTDSERAEHRRKRIETHATNETERISIAEFTQFLRGELAPLYELLQSRGGQLVLLRMPTTDEHWSIDSEVAPKKLFWDQIEELTDIPTIHFADYVELSEFDCPDTSHLDKRDAPEFTRRLSQILKRIL